MKKFLAALMAAIMVMSIISMPALAEKQTSSNTPDRNGSKNHPSEPTGMTDAGNLNEALNVSGGSINFTTFGNYPWVVDGNAAKSSNMGVPNTSSMVYATVNVAEGDIVEFDYMCFGEGNSSVVWDGLQFYVDGTRIIEWAHAESIATFRAALPAGQHELTWIYKKDAENDGEGDYAWLDNVYVGRPTEPSEVLVEAITVPEGRLANVEYTILPENAFDKSVTFSIADESIATVDENGIVRGVAQGSTTITVTTVTGGVAGSADVTVTAGSNETDLIGFFIIDAGDMNGKWGTFKDNAPANISDLGIHTPLYTFGAASVGNLIYGYNHSGESDNRFYLLNPASGSITYPGGSVAAGYTVMGMAFDYTENELYAMVSRDEDMLRSLYRIDRATGTMTMVSDFVNTEGDPMTSEPLVTFAIDNEGMGYGISYFGNLYAIDLNTAVCTYVGNTGLKPQFVQSMTFDMDTNQHFRAFYNGSVFGHLYTVDTDTASVTECGRIGSEAGAEVTCLCTLNDIDVPGPDMPDITVKFIDGLNGSVLASITISAGSAISAESFPVPPIHEGYEFIGWNYEYGALLYHDTTIAARYFDPELYAEFIGYSVYDPNDTLTGKWTIFNTAASGTLTELEVIDPIKTNAAATVGDKIYGFNCKNGDNRFFVLDPETGIISYPGASSLDGYTVSALAYDYRNNELYALAEDENHIRGIYSVDRATGIMTRAANLIDSSGHNMSNDDPITTFAIDNNGKGYAISYMGILYTINLRNGLCTYVGETGYEMKFVQSITWDMNSNQLFWAFYNDTILGHLFLVNPVTAAVVDYGIIGGGAELTGLCTIYTDAEIPPIDLPDITVTFIDSVDNSIIGTYIMAGGNAIPDIAYPTAPRHEGLSFEGWDVLAGTLLYSDTTITARYIDPNALGWFFEEDPAQEGWTYLDSDGDGLTWQWRTLDNGTFVVPEGSGCMGSKSYDNGLGALTPDNWLISPEFEAGTSVTFMMVGQDPQWPAEYVGVYISTDNGETWSDEIAGFTATAKIASYSFDTAEYAGQDVRIAFRHYNSTDMFSVNLDAVEIIGRDIEINPGIPGDANGDGVVDTLDAVMVMRHALSLITLSNEAIALCDMNGDGEITILDATLIMRAALGF